MRKGQAQIPTNCNDQVEKEEEKQKCEVKKQPICLHLRQRKLPAQKNKYVFLDEINHHTGYIFSILRIASVSFNMYSARIACDLVYDFVFCLFALLSIHS